MNQESIPYNKDWSLFLDRDGVINEEQKGSYVTNWSEFKFYEGGLEALTKLSKIFGHLFIVTNQRGVGKGLMSKNDLISLHEKMEQEITSAGGQINKIYACTAISDDDNNRKPNTGMALQAKEDFNNIDFQKSIMVGNNLSDMLFGKRMQMKTIFLSTTQDPFELPHDIIDEQYDSLKSWVETLLLETEMASLN